MSDGNNPVLDHSAVSVGVLDIVLGAREMREIDQYKFQQLVVLCLQTHAWCVREEYNRNLLLAITQGGAPLTNEIITELLNVSEKERTDHATRLSAFASALISGFTKH